MQPTANEPEGQTDWTTVTWRVVNRNVRNLRRRIFRATQQGDWKKVHSLQNLMLRSYSNRLHAVRRVTQVNRGKRTPGVDQVLVKTPRARGKLVDELGQYHPWRATPTKRVYIPKANGKRRPLGIPTIRDRALQAMVKNALEPSWEARFEGISYGFRPGRSCQDAIMRLYTQLTPNKRMTWVVDADIKGAFDHIDHQFLLDVVEPVPGRELIKQWLKAGCLDHGIFHPTIEGTPQGGVISPLLLNIALHGMEEAFGVRRTSQGWLRADCPCAVVRYADDFVVPCTSKEEAQRALDRLRPWLAVRGLTLSEEKTRIVHITEGFDFLGFTIRRYPAPGRGKSGAITLIKPSRDAARRLQDRLRAEWRALHGRPVAAVVRQLNPIIRGWAAYYRSQASMRTFCAIDHWMLTRQVRHVARLHPRRPRREIQDRYWGRLNKNRRDTWVFGDARTDAYMLKFRWFTIQRHVQVKGAHSPDDPAAQEYWENRRKQKARTLTPGRQTLARRQGYVCTECGDSLFNGEELEVHHRIWRSRGGDDSYENLTLRHLYCHQQDHAHRQHESLCSHETCLSRMR
jgi:RNA-directed DNA polymerase